MAATGSGSQDRIRGQETSLFIISGGQTQQLTAIRSFTVSATIKKLTEEYLSQTTPLFDEMFEGYSGEIDLHLDGPTYFALQDGVVLRAQRRVPSFTVNVQTTFNFPVSGRIRRMFNNVFFGDFPANVPSRSDYVDCKLSWMSSTLTTA